jgi:signal transduction histidine kinase
MGPNASLSLALAGMALWHLYRGAPAAIKRAQILAACIAALALVPLVGYLYGATQLYAIARYTGIAIHTGIALLVLSVGILSAQPDIGPVAALMSNGPHAVMARRLLGPAIALPLLLGYLRLAGEQRGWYDTAFGLAVMVVAVIVLLSIAIWRAAVALERSNRARQRAQQHRDELLVREQAARERAERADRAKDEFIAALSHELRTPLNAILGWMQIVQQGAVSDATRAKAAEAVSRNATAMARLIEDLLETSRIATGHLELSRAPVDLSAVTQVAVESVMPAAQARGISVKTIVHGPIPLVIGDAHRLQQVLWNLVSNAIKFSSRGTVQIEVEARRDVVLVRVSDEGSGIDPKFLPHVFDPFRQDGPGSPTGGGGLGLGLHIAKHLVERHGGTIAAESKGAGSGAVFTVELPAGGNSVVDDPAARRLAPNAATSFEAV